MEDKNICYNACANINSENPTAVAEVLHELFKLMDTTEICGAKLRDYAGIKELYQKATKAA